MASTVVKAAYWFNGCGIPVADIDSTLFTHLFCAFADLDPNTHQVTIAPENMVHFSTFTQTVQLPNPSVKTLLSIGGRNATAATNFAAMASQPGTRGVFIDSSISLARSYNFLGLDLDWEYPKTNEEMDNLRSLLNEWREAVKMEARSPNQAPLLLTAAAYSSSSHHGIHYPIEAISNSLDWINLMADDFYTPRLSPNVAGPHAALYNTRDPLACGDVGVRAWIIEGVPAKQLVLGLPFHGYAWKLVHANNNRVFAPANGAADGPGIARDGSIVYKQIVNFISQSSAAKAYDAPIVVDYCYSKTTWIGYDDTNSITNKVQYAGQKGLGGYFAWHVGGDKDWTLSRTAFGAWPGSVGI